MLVSEDFISNILSHMRVTDGSSDYYDPQKAHDYYLRTRELKGRQPAVKEAPKYQTKTNPTSTFKRQTTPQNLVTVKRQQLVNSRVAGLQKRLGQLQDLLKNRLDRAAKREKNKNVKPTAKQKQAATKSSDKYRNTNKAEIAKKAKAAYDKNPDANLSVDQIKSQIVTIQGQLKTAIADAQKQLSNPQTVKSR